MNFSEKISHSLSEKDVENIYRSELSLLKDSIITSPYKVDGLLESENIRCLLEFKFDENFKEKISQCNVLIQCLYYLKKFENNGNKMPKTILIGDRNECFVIHTNSIIRYLSYEIDWNIAPSEACKRNPEMLQDMLEDDDINPFVFDIDKDFNIFSVIRKLKEYTENIKNKIRITKSNIVNIYNLFDSRVLDKNKLTTNEKVNLFIQIVINPEGNFLHPKNKNVLISKSFGELKIKRDAFISFFNHFEGDVYSPREKEGLTELSDRLIEDLTRRSKGEFYTPTTHVNLSHTYLDEVFGEDWREKFVVWDCCCGTGNLTRDYRFKELYCSTLEQSDLDTMSQMDYNPEAVKFQFDFLNDGNDKLPDGLRKAIKNGKEILFLINPPYMRSGNNKMAKTKSGVSESLIVNKMKGEGFGACTANLYAQFLYRIYKYQEIKNNIKIGLFSPTLYLTGSSFEKFRNKFLNNFGYEKGFVFPASHFSDVSDGWGVSFSVWSEKIKVNKNEFIHDVIEGLTDLPKFNKIIYNIDGEKGLSDWVKEDLTKTRKIETPQLTSAIKIKQTKGDSICEGAIGSLMNNMNSVYVNQTNIGMFSSSSPKGYTGLSVLPENFNKICSVFTARKSIKPDWLNQKDEYMVPDISHPEYKQFEKDSIIYSLFNNSSQQSGLRQIEYKNKLWDIKNEFFWMSKDDIIELANKSNFDELYHDAKTDKNRFVYNKLFEENIYNELSTDAKEILDLAMDLTKKSMPMRKVLSKVKPEYHLNAWDAGYAQLKIVWKEYYKEDYDNFRKKYKDFNDRMSKLVYELGFLKP